MIKPINEQTENNWSRRLTYAACIFWLISLTLPSFIVESHAEPWFGILTLVFGIVFGWFVQGWAAYANIFFAFAAIAIFVGRKPRISVIAMLFLAATLPLFKGVVLDGGSGAILSVVSWGWGTVLWLCSLALLAVAAAVRMHQLSISAMKSIVGLLLIILVTLGTFHFYQRSVMNLQEQKLYLSNGIAFTLAEPCGVLLTNVEAPLLPSNVITTLDIAPDLINPKGRVPYLFLPKLMNYQEGYSAWRTFQDPVISSIKVKVRVASRPDNPVLQAQKTESGAVLRLLSNPSGRVLYEQELKATSTKRGSPVYCPLSTQSGVAGLQLGYDTNLLKALGKKQVTKTREKLSEEVARVPCSLGSEDKSGIEGLRDWDGREVILQPESVRSRIGFCSESYIVLTYISEYSATSLSNLSPVAQIFDRKTLRPLASFNSGHACPRGNRCTEAPRELARGVRISDEKITVETTGGDIIANHRN